jgi:bifunctional DNA-binding transcriptional regulator/antitoxin component of YhaV-PrlF toxin-antitoxin module
MYNLGEVSTPTAITKRGQTVIPAIPRRRYAIDETVQLVWLDDGDTIGVVPIPSDPLRALRGRGRGEGLAEKLLIERQQDCMQR